MTMLGIQVKVISTKDWLQFKTDHYIIFYSDLLNPLSASYIRSTYTVHLSIYLYIYSNIFPYSVLVAICIYIYVCVYRFNVNSDHYNRSVISLQSSLLVMAIWQNNAIFQKDNLHLMLVIGLLVMLLLVQATDTTSHDALGLFFFSLVFFISISLLQIVSLLHFQLLISVIITIIHPSIHFNTSWAQDNLSCH